MAVSLKVPVFCDVMPFGFINGFQRFGVTCCFPIQGQSVQKELFAPGDEGNTH